MDQARSPRLRFACVLFDHDDTLVPTFGLRVAALHAAAREALSLELDAAAFLGESHGRSLEKMSLQLSDGDAHRATRLVTAYRHHYRQRSANALAAFDGIAETLAALRARGVRVGVATSKLGHTAQVEIAATGLAPYVEFLVGAEHVTRHKPEPEPLLRAMTALEATPERTLMVGDTSADILGARNAGVASAAALWGAVDRDTLLALAPDHRLEHPREILALCVAESA